MRMIIIFAACIAVLAPTNSQSQNVDGIKYPDLLNYGIWPKSKITEIDGYKFRIWFHPNKPFIMIQPTFLGALSGFKFPYLDLVFWQDAAQAIVEPYRCKITDIAPKTKTGATWNAQYLCPDEKVINPSEAPG